MLLNLDAHLRVTYIRNCSMLVTVWKTIHVHTTTEQWLSRISKTTMPKFLRHDHAKNRLYHPNKWLLYFFQSIETGRIWCNFWLRKWPQNNLSEFHLSGDALSRNSNFVHVQFWLKKTGPEKLNTSLQHPSSYSYIFIISHKCLLFHRHSLSFNEYLFLLCLTRTLPSL